MSRADSQRALEQELEAGRVRLVGGQGPPSLLRLLRSRLARPTDNLFIVHSIPEQGEDIYDVLVDGQVIVRVEVPCAESRASGLPSVEEVSLARYRELLSKLHRRRLDAALQLAQRMPKPSD